MRIVKWLDEHFEETLLVFFLILISFVMLAQIIMRYMLNSSLTWAEEFCRYCYVWTAFLSLGYCAKMDNMLRVGVLLDLFPKRLRALLFIIAQIITVGFFGVFAYHSISVISIIKQMGQTSTAMGWPTYIVYYCTFIGFALGFLRGLQRLVIMLKNFGEPIETTIESVIKEAEAEASMAAADASVAAKEN